MEKKILSIIVPTYNMEKYLSYCLDSFCVQRNRDKLEVIIVNDGSKDRSLQIAEEYVAQDAQLFRIIDKKNGNYGSCINAALPEVRAKYVKVVDADDSVDSENLEDFLDFLSEHEVDLALSDFVLVNEERETLKEVSYHFGSEQLPMKEVCVTERFQDMEMHAVTYRSQLLQDMGYHQTEGISYTDQQWIFTPMVGVQQVGFFNRPVYKYLVGREGQTIDPAVKIKKMSDRVRYVEDMIVQYEVYRDKVSRDIKSYLDARLVPNVKDIYVTYFSNRSKVKKSLMNEFEAAFKNNSLFFYKELSASYRYIGYWRVLKDFPLMEKCFCSIFTRLLCFKK